MGKELKYKKKQARRQVFGRQGGREAETSNESGSLKLGRREGNLYYAPRYTLDGAHIY